MIIDKIAESWTDEEKKELNRLRHESKKILEPLGTIETDEEYNVRLEKYSKVSEAINLLHDKVERRYVESKGEKALLEDIQEIVSNITKKDFLDYIADNREVLAKVELLQNRASLPYDDGVETIRKMTLEDYDNCYNFILRQIRVQLQALLISGKYITKITDIVDTRILLLGYGKPHYIHQGTVSNALTKIRANKRNTTIDLLGTATIKSGDFTITIPEFAKNKAPRTSTYQLLDALTVKLTETGAKSPVVVLPLDDYMRMRGLTDRKEARKQAVEDLEILFSDRISGKEKRTKEQEKAFFDMRIIDFKGIDKKGNITVTFGTAYYNIHKNYPVMYYPPQLWLLNGKRNPNSYYLLRKISEHKNMNVGKKNEDIIAVKTLIANAPTLPSYAEVMDTDKHLSQRIIEPFERDMDTLADTLTWEYCHSNGEPLKKEELDNLNYDTFIGLMIKTAWTYYPDQTARMERKAERQAKAKATRKRATKKKSETT